MLVVEQLNSDHLKVLVFTTGSSAPWGNNQNWVMKLPQKLRQKLPSCRVRMRGCRSSCKIWSRRAVMHRKRLRPAHALTKQRWGQYDAVCIEQCNGITTYINNKKKNLITFQAEMLVMILAYCWPPRLWFFFFFCLLNRIVWTHTRDVGALQHGCTHVNAYFSRTAASSQCLTACGIQLHFAFFLFAAAT